MNLLMVALALGADLSGILQGSLGSVYMVTHAHLIGAVVKPHREMETNELKTCDIADCHTNCDANYTMLLLPDPD